MSWIVIGDEFRATLACDTVDRPFGTIHYNYGDESAKEELREFGRWLENDPRTYNPDVLLQKYNNWVNSEY